MTKLIFLLLWLQFSMTTTEEHLEMFTDSQMAAMCGLDEDEFERFVNGRYRECPYYDDSDEYKTVRKQM